MTSRVRLPATVQTNIGLRLRVTTANAIAKVAKARKCSMKQVIMTALHDASVKVDAADLLDKSIRPRTASKGVAAKCQP